MRGTDGAWIVRGVSARLSFPELTAVVSTDALARRAVVDATVARVIPEEGRAWVGGVPVMRGARRRVQSLLAEIDLSIHGAARAGGWPRLQRLLTGRPASEPGDLLRMRRHVRLEAAREGLASERADAAPARARLARALVPRPDHVLVADVDAALTEGDASVPGRTAPHRPRRQRGGDLHAYDVEVDEKCVELLALYQPAAGDLRFITTAMKIVTDLERIGDQAVNIAQRVLELNREPQLKPYIDLPRMADNAQRMVKESLDAFVARDTGLARRVCAEDSTVDDLKEQIFRELLTFMMEMVVYMVESKMVRHTLA